MRRIFNILRQKNTVPSANTAGRTEFRKEGDLARDRRNWAAAEKHYTTHLTAQPDDAAIWVQLGHALKEQSKLPAAEDAYRRATGLTPNDPDAHLQLGHALKQQAKRAEAAQSFARSLELAPTRATFDEVTSLGGTKRASKILGKAARQNAPDVVLFEVDDLLGWLQQHRTLSGIQRVQVGIVRNVLSKILSDDEGKFGFVRTRNEGGGFWQFWPTDLQDIIEYATGTDVERGELTRLLAKAEQAAVELKPAKGQCYFILGAFWGFNGDASRYARLKQAGVLVGVYIYDLIPITHPEFCDAHLVSEFTLSLGDGFSVFDFVLAISEFAAQDVRRLQESLGLRRVPVQAVPLAHVLREELLEEDSSGWTPAISALRGRRFVLSVSTIEARKNHAYLVTAWRLMLEEGLDPPDLVFVGKYGWRVNDFMDQIKATGFLGGRIHILHDLPDAELEMLYRHCQFTAFPSFVEGWGLPVGESLAHGRPCVASNTSSIPEVGGNLVDYIDPFNVRAGVEAFRRMAFDEAYRAKREQDVREHFIARSWKTVTADLLGRIEQLRHVPADRSFDPLLRPGDLFFPGKLRQGQPIPPDYLKRPLRPILASSWYPPEAFGTWMRGRLSVLRFRTDLEAGSEIVVYLRLLGTTWTARQAVHVSIEQGEADNDGAASLQLPDSTLENFPRNVLNQRGYSPIQTGAFTLRVNGQTGAYGMVKIFINITGQSDPLPPGETRELSIGFVGLGYAKADDVELRLDIAEALVAGS